MPTSDRGGLARLPVAAVIATAALTALVACGGGTSGGTGSIAPAEPAPARSVSTTAVDDATRAAVKAAGLVGPGCASYLAANPDGPGSIDAMARARVTVADRHNPLLKTLNRAVTGRLNPDVDLAGTFDSGRYTVFAPVDDAFVKLPAATVTVLAHNGRRLKRVLRYHLVEGRLAPSELAGVHRTVEGGDLQVTGSGGALQVNGANVICGGLRTANATVYLIDAVLRPPER